MAANSSISLIIPAYNEEELIGQTINVCAMFLQRITEDYEIIVVNDGSTDTTGQVIDEFAYSNERIKPLHNICNKGSGAALWAGMKRARYNIIATNFADLPFDINELSEALILLNDDNVDFVVVARRNRSANSPYRKMTSLTNYWLIRMLFNVKLRDFQFVQIYRKKVIDRINIKSMGTFMAPELIIKALANGFWMREYSASFYPRTAGRAKCGNPRVIIETIYEMVRFWFCWVILYHE